MTYTKEQMKVLAAWEEHLGTAVRANWARNPGREALRTIHSIYTAATGDRHRLVTTCSRCMLSLLQDAGRVYFRDLEEMKAKKKTKK